MCQAAGFAHSTDTGTSPYSQLLEGLPPRVHQELAGVDGLTHAMHSEVLRAVAGAAVSETDTVWWTGMCKKIRRQTQLDINPGCIDH